MTIYLATAGFMKKFWAYCSREAVYNDLSEDTLPTETTNLQNHIVA